MHTLQSLLFTGLAQRHGVSRAMPFSQRAWRKRHFAVDPGGLCAGLAHFWLMELLQRRRPLGRLRDPTPSTLEQIVELQSRSLYPEFSASHEFTDDDLELLWRKYGSADWVTVSRRIHDAVGGDCILYDLHQLFDYDSARIHTDDVLPVELEDFSELEPGSAFVAVLRYRRSGREAGHRVVFYLSRMGRYHFFDPNAGAVVEPDSSRFRRWLGDYYQVMPQRSFEPPASGPALRLYELRGVRCVVRCVASRPQPAARPRRRDA